MYYRSVGRYPSLGAQRLNGVVLHEKSNSYGEVTKSGGGMDPLFPPVPMPMPSYALDYSVIIVFIFFT